MQPAPCLDRPSNRPYCSSLSLRRPQSGYIHIILNTMEVELSAMSPPEGRCSPNTLSRPPPKSVLQILAALNSCHECRSCEMAAATGLSPQTVSLRLNQLARAGLLEAFQTRNFPRLTRYRLSASSADIAKAAAVLLRELESRSSAQVESSLIRDLSNRLRDNLNGLE